MRWLITIPIVAVFSCLGGDTGPTDASVTADAGTLADAGGAADAGAHESDGGAVDAGEIDAGATGPGTDGGETLDAGLAADAGTDRAWVLAGGTSAIDVFTFDHATGTLTRTGGLLGIAGGISWLAPDLSRSRVYASHSGSGEVSAYRFFTADGGLELLNRVSSGGTTPAHIGVDSANQRLWVANYGNGNVSALTITAGGLGTVAQSLAPGGQPHQVYLDGAYAYVPCKAADRVAQYAFNGAALQPLTPASMATAANAGPRHLAKHPTLPRAYLVNEVGNTVQTLNVGANGLLQSTQTLTTLPAGFAGTNTAAEVAVHPNGKFVYGSNRGHDSIVRFGVNQTSGQLTLLGHTPTGGNTPRHFSISPSGRWLLVANQDSDEIVVFEINIATGELTLSSQVPTVAGPKFVGFWGPL